MLGSDKVSVQVHRAQNGFDGVCQNRGAVLAAGLGLTFAQAQQLGQLELERNLVQRAFLDEVGTHARQITFGQLTQALEQKTGDGQTQHRVSQKLQTLVVVCREAAVRQRTLQQGRILECVLQRLLQFLQGDWHLFGLVIKTVNKVGRAYQRNGTLIFKAHHNPVIDLGDLQILARDGGDVINLCSPVKHCTHF